ncbi:hypothetical protein EVAR_40741_1 [Eumeta japonica]|uniref:Uncharacterized protein n=1 Tax=Eumeta variegata TaxID=151549 RepID=A0A4C1X7J0_EUMVA|nr:hypothetical protein EVAR_40741_1 [Eumeta japonica]
MRRVRHLWWVNGDYKTLLKVGVSCGARDDLDHGLRTLGRTRPQCELIPVSSTDNTPSDPETINSYMEVLVKTVILGAAMATAAAMVLWEWWSFPRVARAHHAYGQRPRRD